MCFTLLSANLIQSTRTHSPGGQAVRLHLIRHQHNNNNNDDDDDEDDDDDDDYNDNNNKTI